MSKACLRKSKVWSLPMRCAEERSEQKSKVTDDATNVPEMTSSVRPPRGIGSSKFGHGGSDLRSSAAEDRIFELPAVVGRPASVH